MGHCWKCGAYMEASGYCPACKRQEERQRFEKTQAEKAVRDHERIAEEQRESLARENRRAARDLQARIDADKREREKEREREHLLREQEYREHERREAEQREKERLADPDRWTGHEWAVHVCQRPEDAFKCRWDKMDGEDLTMVFMRHPNFVENVDGWKGRLTGDDWAELLSCQPGFADSCDWSKLSSENYVDLLIKRPEFRDRCGFGGLAPKDWSRLLAVHPDFGGICKCWNKMTVGDWEILLKSQHAFGDKCDWSKFSKEFIIGIVKANRKLIDYCVEWSQWGMFETADIEYLVAQFSEWRAKFKWNKMRGYALAPVLVEHPDLYQHGNWQSFSDDDLRCLVETVPSLANVCDLSALSVDSWAKLLMKRPQLADKCDKLGAFKDLQWVALIERQPQLVERCDFNAFSFPVWIEFVKKHPEYAERRTGWLEYQKQSADKIKAETERATAARVAADEDRRAKMVKNDVKKQECAQSKKKRWKFITLGLLFGWMGAHYLYAKRLFLLLLLWVSFITGISMIGSSQGDERQPSQDATTEVAKKSSTNEAIGGGCIALWALLWLGGTFFVKKDGKGNRM